MTEKILNEYGIKMNNEQSLFENKINLTKSNIHIKPKVLFRNDALNDVINGIKNSRSENIFFSEPKTRNINNKEKNLNKFRKTNILKLPSLSEKTIKIKEFLNINNKIKKEKEKVIFNKHINTDDKRKRYIDNIMQSCCSVVKMNIQKNVNKNKDCFLCYKLRNKDDNYKPIFLYKNKKNKNQKFISKYKRVNFLPSNSLYKKNIKILVSEETMTNFNNKNKEINKNNDNNLDYLISRKIYNSSNIEKNNLHLNKYNFNQEYSNIKA